MNIQMIPLNRLIPSPANVRKTGGGIGIEDLAASIKAHGLLQNLQVRPAKGGKFEVVAGARRLKALQALAKEKAIGKTAEIGCNVLDAQDDGEISLAENVIRLDEDDQEAVRQHAVAALNLTQKAKEVASGSSLGEESANTAFVDGVRKFAMDVRELDIDLIDRINPFGEAYAILAKKMNEDSLQQVHAAIAAKRTSLTPEEAKMIAKRAVEFKRERGRLPSISSTDAWEKHLAEGAAAFVWFKDEGRYE